MRGKEGSSLAREPRPRGSIVLRAPPKPLRHPPGASRPELAGRPLPPPGSRLLRLRAGSPVLQICPTTYDQTGRPFEYLESLFRGDRGDRYIYHYHAELKEGASQLTVRPTEELIARVRG